MIIYVANLWKKNEIMKEKWKKVERIFQDPMEIRSLARAKCECLYVLVRFVQVRKMKCLQTLKLCPGKSSCLTSYNVMMICIQNNIKNRPILSDFDIWANLIRNLMQSKEKRTIGKLFNSISLWIFIFLGKIS